MYLHQYQTKVCDFKQSNVFSELLGLFWGINGVLMYCGITVISLALTVSMTFNNVTKCISNETNWKCINVHHEF